MRNPYANKSSIEYKFRLKRFGHIERIIQSIVSTKGSCRILDVGGTEQYWNLGKELIRKNDVQIHLLNLNNVETSCDNFTSFVGDARDLSQFSDNSYDFCHSNSVIEHVGDWQDMVSMSKEVSRLSKSYFVQVPYYWFPIEPHFRTLFFHWCPEQIRYRLLMKFDLGFHTRQDDINGAMINIQSARLLDRSQLSCLFPDAKIVPEKFGFLTKSLMAIRTEEV